MRRIDTIRQMSEEEFAENLIEECNDDTVWWEDGKPVVVYRRSWLTPFAEFDNTWSYERVKQKVVDWLKEDVGEGEV